MLLKNFKYLHTSKGKQGTCTLKKIATTSFLCFLTYIKINTGSKYIQLSHKSDFDCLKII